jgi:hypothetical protein
VGGIYKCRRLLDLVQIPIHLVSLCAMGFQNPDIHLIISLLHLQSSRILSTLFCYKSLSHGVHFRCRPGRIQNQVRKLRYYNCTLSNYLYLYNAVIIRTYMKAFALEQLPYTVPPSNNVGKLSQSMYIFGLVQ